MPNPNLEGQGFRLRWPSLSHYLKIFTSNVIAVLLYGCETWRVTKNDPAKLDVFLHKNLRRTIGL